MDKAQVRKIVPVIDPQDIYLPLYLDKEKFIILITGGRGSGKSYNGATFIERLTFEMTPVQRMVHQILYTRYTMISAFSKQQKRTLSIR